MKKIYIYDKQTEKMVEKRPENELPLPEIPVPETSFKVDIGLWTKLKAAK